jgi:predicted chitinase
MDENKMQRQMEFIVEQQAQFAAQIGQLEDGLTRLVGVVERVVDTVARLAQVMTERFEAVDRRDDETDRKIAALVDAQIQTEEAVRHLAATVDRHIAEGHNGRARPEG